MKNIKYFKDTEAYFDTYEFQKEYLPDNWKQILPDYANMLHITITDDINKINPYDKDSKYYFCFATMCKDCFYNTYSPVQQTTRFNSVSY